MITFSHDFKFYACVYSSRNQRGLIVYIIGICLQGKKKNKAKVIQQVKFNYEVVVNFLVQNM